jgi:hypothetical protein
VLITYKVVLIDPCRLLNSSSTPNLADARMMRQIEQLTLPRESYQRALRVISEAQIKKLPWMSSYLGHPATSDPEGYSILGTVGRFVRECVFSFKFLCDWPQIASACCGVELWSGASSPSRSSVLRKLHQRSILLAEGQQARKSVKRCKMR